MEGHASLVGQLYQQQVAVKLVGTGKGGTVTTIDVRCRTAFGVHIAIELLLDFKLPDVNAVNNEGNTAMDVAADYNNDNLVRLLLKYS